VDFAYEQNVQVIVNGVRSHQDWLYESNLHSLGDSQKLGIDTFILFTKPNLAHVSSSAVKDLQREQGLIQDYVPAYVKQCVEAKLSQQYIIGLSGEIGSGKSYLGEQLVELGQAAGIEVHNIELDQLSWQIQSDLNEAKYALVRAEIIETFGPVVANEDGTINRKALGEIVFADAAKLELLNEIMRTPIMVRLRRELKNKTGLIILNAALLLEAKMSSLVNNNMILLDVDAKIQQQRLLARGLEPEQIQRRLESQYDLPHKSMELKKMIQRDQQGKLWLFNNDRHDEQAQRALLQDIVAYFKIPTR